MTTDRWHQVKEIFQAALDQEPSNRSRFLSRACGDDHDLRREVESLIASHEKTGTFIDSPAFKANAEQLVADAPQLKPSERIASYEVISFISRGGMGEVYLAQDQRLSRRVALKILPASFTRDVDRLARFEQEARAASALNHPNIITIYEILKTDSTHVIATEFVEGETLQQRLASDSFTVSEALLIAIQIADALTAAHKAGIIHRDIKPENVMLRPDGYVKVLDFGLAKLAEAPSSLPAAEAPTKKVKTASGIIIGTVGYMSPEQARGQQVDARTDIFSLGAVIYEMVAGRKPFAGDTQSDVLAAILKSEPPPLTSFAPDAPAELLRIVTKGLRKDREERYQVIKDLLLDLKSLRQELEFQQRLKQTSPESDQTAADRAEMSISVSEADKTRHTDELVGVTPTAISKSPLSLMIKPRRWPVFALIAIFIAGGLFGIYKLFRNNSSSNSAAVAPTVANVKRITAWSALDTQPTLSPDGNSVAYVSNHDGSFEIYVKQLTTGGREIQLTSDQQENFQPAWSPDAQQIAYYSKKRGGIWVVPALGGAPRQLTEFGSAPAWSRDSTMIAFQSDSDPDLGSASVGSSTIWIAPAQGGTPKQITNVGNPTGGHVNPNWSPDGRRIAFSANNFTTQQLWSVSVTGDIPKQLTHRPNAKIRQPRNWIDPVAGRATYPVYSPDGRGIYFVVNSRVWMLPISPKDDEPEDDPVSITDAGASSIGNLTLSADGKKMAYGVQTLTSNLWTISISPTNNTLGTLKPLTNQTDARNTQPQFSPDGQKLAFLQYLQGGSPTLWLADAQGKSPAQVTVRVNVPSWFPDGDQIAFTSNRENHWSIWSTSLKSRRDRLLFDIGRDIQYARLSPDGKQVAFNLADGGIINLWTVPVSGGQPKQLTFDKELAGFACWSPDGRFIAYQMKRGDDAHLMLMSSDGGESTQLTSGHGRSWPYSFSPDGDKILFAGERDGVWNVWWISRSTHQQKQLTNYTKVNAFVRYPAWSPLGNQIAYEYAETTGNIWLVELK